MRLATACCLWWPSCTLLLHHCVVLWSPPEPSALHKLPPSYPCLSFTAGACSLPTTVCEVRGCLSVLCRGLVFLAQGSTCLCESPESSGKFLTPVQVASPGYAESWEPLQRGAELEWSCPSVSPLSSAVFLKDVSVLTSHHSV